MPVDPELLAAAAGAISCLVTARRLTDRRRWAGRWVGAGCACWAAGEAIWTYHEVVLHRGVLVRSAADVGYLLFPPFAACGLLLASGTTDVRARLRILLDGITVACALFILSWATVLGAVWRAGADDVLSFAVSVAYPITDIVLPCRHRLAGRVPGGRGRRGRRTGTPGRRRVGVRRDHRVAAAAAPRPGTGHRSRRRPAGHDARGATRRDGRDRAARGRRLRPAAAAAEREPAARTRPRDPRGGAAAPGHARPLTGLANRNLFADRLEHALTLRRRTTRPLAVVFLDLDDFKEINDSLGHPAGDALLMNVSGRLRTVLRGGDTIARFGGDEFAVLLEDDLVDPMVPAHRILGAFEEPFLVEGRALTVGASIGLVAASINRDTSATELLRDADIAMYAAKHRGKGGIEIFTAEMQHRGSEELDLRVAFAAALERDEISVVFQPIVDAGTGVLHEFEALARWTHPELGPIGPDRFVPLAERSHLVNALTDRVLDLVCRDLAGWLPDHPGARVAVNVTADQLADPALPVRLTTALGRYAVEGHRLTVEVTETALMHDVESAAAALRRIKSLGRPSPWTTSVPATPRSRGCGTSTSTCSRSTGSSCATSRRTPVAATSSRP